MAAGMARRKVIGGLASASLLGLQNKLWAAASSEPNMPLADRLAAYADDLRFQDLDADTVEQVKAHLIDTLAAVSPPSTNASSASAAMSRRRSPGDPRR